MIHVRTTHSEWTDTPGWRSRGATHTTLDIAERPLAQEGTWGAEPYVLEAGADERIVIKHRYSGFYQTSLELNLRARGVDCIVMAGVQTDTCVLQTAMDALFRGIVPVVVSDATTSGTPERHREGLNTLSAMVGGVASTEQVLQASPAVH